MSELKDRVFIITGSGGAIAGPIIDAFAAAGAHLVLAEAHDSARVRERAAQTGGLMVQVDLATAAGAETMVGAAEERFGRVDGLIHTVGGFAMGRLHEVDPAQYDRMFDLNVRTLFHAVRAMLPRLLARGDGFLAGIAAGPGWSGSAPGMSLYGAAKSAATTLLRSLDEELAGTAIQVAIVYPMGAVDTPGNRKEMPDADPSRWIDPGAIAQALLFAATRGPRGRMREFPVWPPR
ncbi:MAG: SDR family NAD(P)-dependent oxidoreductase [Myxococcales bacterium]|nr:SDR family NAD(P)-dependent oxidoreductase [Myxococcales bacterium]